MIYDELRKELLGALNCSTCAHPYGNTSEYDLNLLNKEESQCRELKEQLLKDLQDVAVEFYRAMLMQMDVSAHVEIFYKVLEVVTCRMEKGALEAFLMGNCSKKIGIVCCSNGQKTTYAEKIRQLENTLLDMGVEPVFSDFIYEKEDIFCGTAKERAKALMDFYREEQIAEICDISGGDVANGNLSVPIAVMRDIGHGTDAKGIVIGESITLEK